MLNNFLGELGTKIILKSLVIVLPALVVISVLEVFILILSLIG